MSSKNQKSKKVDQHADAQADQAGKQQQQASSATGKQQKGAPKQQTVAAHAQQQQQSQQGHTQAPHHGPAHQNYDDVSAGTRSHHTRSLDQSGESQKPQQQNKKRQ